MKRAAEVEGKQASKQAGQVVADGEGWWKVLVSKSLSKFWGPRGVSEKTSIPPCPSGHAMAVEANEQYEYPKVAGYYCLILTH